MVEYRREAGSKLIPVKRCATEVWFARDITIGYTYGKFFVIRRDIKPGSRIWSLEYIPELMVEKTSEHYYKRQRERLLDYQRAVNWLANNPNILPQPIFEELLTSL